MRDSSSMCGTSRQSSIRTQVNRSHRLRASPAGRHRPESSSTGHLPLQQLNQRDRHVGAGAHLRARLVAVLARLGLSRLLLTVLRLLLLVDERRDCIEIELVLLLGIGRRRALPWAWLRVLASAFPSRPCPSAWAWFRSGIASGAGGASSARVLRRRGAGVGAGSGFSSFGSSFLLAALTFATRRRSPPRPECPA